MSHGPWWARALKWGLWALVMSLIMGWVARTRLHPRAGRQTGVLQHPRSLLAIGLVCVGFFGALAILSHVFPGKSGSPLISLFFLGFASLGVPLVAEYFRVRHELEPGGLRYRPLLSQPGALRWNEVMRVRYSHSAKWFRLDTLGGEVVRISAMLTGLPEFASTVLREVPASRIDDNARVLLEQTAAGSPPSIWG